MKDLLAILDSLSMSKVGSKGEIILSSVFGTRRI
jgi:hypothetical protein